MMGDPLLFIESIPVAETRAYVKRVLTYHWMYGLRLRAEAQSLDDTALGGWPLYRNPTVAPIPSTTGRAPGTGGAVVPVAPPGDVRPSS